jgi:MtN3 and saliva related transmembrane protein
MEFGEIIGYSAAILMVLGYVPQTIRTIRTRKTDDIALGSFVLMALGSICFFLQGIAIGNLPLVLANGLTATMSTVIFAIKIKNDYFSKGK